MVSKIKNSLKNSKNNNHDNITIDAKHNEMINYFDDLDRSVPNLKEKLNNLVEEYKISKDKLRKNDIEYISERNFKKEEIIELKNKINNIISKNDINEYYLNVGSLLHNYYENIENSKNNNDIENFEDNLINYEKDSKKKKKEIDNNSVLTFFNNRDKNNDENIDKITENNYTSMKISDFVKEESKFKKKYFLDDYLQKIDPNYISQIKIDTKIYKCDICDNEMTLYPSDGVQICNLCGNQEFVLIESDKPSFKDPPLEVCYFSYKRINHFNEWLAQFQAKESTEIPDEVYEQILAEIKKERIKDLSKLDTKKIRHYLKKIKLNKYYDHAAHILYQINGILPPSMSKELEEKLRLMFKEIQGPFMKVCPKSRKNFLNYSYVLHKFVELLSLDEYKIYFPLLKDREKLHQTDMIWKKICEILGWHFIKSI